MLVTTEILSNGTISEDQKYMFEKIKKAASDADYG